MKSKVSKSVSNYAALEDSLLDSRVPLRTEDEFLAGVAFVAKLVGCGHVPRPNSRVEIVAAMRRIRCECRSRGDKKRKVALTVSFDGVRVSLTGRGGASLLALAAHPIHRIFYVSHDSLDLHVFSYIARDGNAFKCLVFKAAKKCVAVNVVRTIGQAFELCHKLAISDNSNSCDNSADNHDNLTAIATTNTNTNNPPIAVVEDCAAQVSQLLKDIDAKLDKLGERVAALETQISTLTVSATTRQQRDRSTDAIESPPPPTSPDSLLSSPAKCPLVLPLHSLCTSSSPSASPPPPPPHSTHSSPSASLLLGDLFSALH